MAISISDIIAAQRAYAQARQNIIQDASKQSADPVGTARKQQEALMQYLQARVKVLTDARTQALAQFDAQIASYQQKIGELQQITRETSAAARSAPSAPPPSSDQTP